MLPFSQFFVCRIVDTFRLLPLYFPNFLSFAYQILPTISCVNNVEEIIIYGTNILPPCRPTFHPNPVGV